MKISAPRASAYLLPRRVTRSSASSDLNLFLSVEDNIYSDAYSNTTKSVEVDLSSPGRYDSAEDSFRVESKSSNAKEEIIDEKSVLYLSDNSDSDDNITIASTHSQPTRKRTGLSIAERNREKLRENSLLKSVEPPSEVVLDCVPLILSADEMNDSSVPEVLMAASSKDSVNPSEVEESNSRERVEKRQNDSDTDETAVQEDLGPRNESTCSPSIPDRCRTEPQLAGSPVQDAADPHPPPPPILVTKPVRKTPVSMSTCCSSNSAGMKDGRTQIVSPSSRGVAHSPHPIPNSSSSK